MTYITPPNSLVTGTTITADPIYSNFVAFKDGLSDGTKSIYVNSVNVAVTLTVGTNLETTGDFTVEGKDIGGKYWFPISLITSYAVRDYGNGYLSVSDGGTSVYSTVSQPIKMASTGSVRAFTVQYHSATEVTGSFGIQLRVNGSSVGSVSVNRADSSTWGQVGTISRGVASFASGGYVSAYLNSSTCGTGGYEHLRVYAEVQFDA